MPTPTVVSTICSVGDMVRGLLVVDFTAGRDLEPAVKRADLLRLTRAGNSGAGRHGEP